MTLRQVFYLLRPHTFPASLTPVVVVLVLTFVERGGLLFPQAILALLVAVLAQSLSNVSNDLFDYKKGADGALRKGFERPLASGKVTYKAVKNLAICLAFLTVLSGGILIALSSWYLSFLGILVIVAAVAYTGGPFPLAYHGWGEVLVFLFYGIVPGLTSYYIQTDTLSLDALLLSASVGCANVNILLVNNYRDYESDKACGKRTLIVRYGKELAPLLYLCNLLLSVAFLLPFASLWGIVLLGIYLAFMLSVLRQLKVKQGEELNAVLIATAKGVSFLSLCIVALLSIDFL